MAKAIGTGDCVKIPDGRIGRVREIGEGGYKVRVQRKTSKTHQFLEFSGKQLEVIDCPKGWMSPTGYNNYIKVTLAKMRKRLASQRR